MSITRQFFTIGHSTRTVGEFVNLLRPQGVSLVVDVRKIPRSRLNPQYNDPQFAEALREFQIGYQHIAALGGLRTRDRNIAEDVNWFWKNRSFHNYADYATSAEFRTGLARLRELGHAATCAIMCAEALWWQCHRRIIADHLVAAGEIVFHLMWPNRIEAAHLTDGAKLGADGTLTYPEAGSSA
jgi:uncharacterized protein (DUF488 family)